MGQLTRYDGDIDSPGSFNSTGRPSWNRRLRVWIIEHDDSWLFIGAYVTLAVVLSIAIGLFWLIVVVAVHGLFEWIRQIHHPHRDLVSLMTRVSWELKLDVGLVIFAIALAVYMDMILGAAGLGSAARMGMQAGARFAGWQSVIRGVLLSVDDAAHVVRAIGRSNSNASEDDAEPAAAPVQRRWGGWTQPRWGVGDWIAIGLFVVSVASLLAGPWLSSHDLPGIMKLLGDELHPWPTADAEVAADTVRR